MNVYIPNLRLPSAYQEVEYIQSSGTQYIDTLLNANQNTIVEAKWSLTQYSELYGKMYGVYGENDDNVFFMQSNRPADNKFRIVNYTNRDVYRKYVDSSANLVLGQIYETKHTNTEFYVDGTLQGTCSSTTYTSGYSITIFGLNMGNNNIIQNAYMKLYYFRMYNGNTLVRDFIPCYRKSDSVIGMYDLVNSVFYTNSGSGTFSKGNDVNKTELKNAYIGEYGWKPGSNTLWYLNLDQSNAVFTDAMGHSTTNYGVTYNTNGVMGGCGYNSGGTNVVQSLFNSGESFPSNFTIMGFMKPAGSHTDDHNKGICLGDASNKRAFYIGFATNNSSVVFGCMKLGVGWYEQTATPSSGNILNEWHHYAMTYNGNTMIGYIDGIQKFTYNVSGSGSGNVSLVGFTLIGERNSSGGYGNCINGYVDEAICEKKVRTATDLQEYLSLVNFLN